MKDQVFLEPLILSERQFLGNQDTSDNVVGYDFGRQISIHAPSGVPLLTFLESNRQRGDLKSDFGETTQTCTMEGIDSTERTSQTKNGLKSDFGESTLTETREGTDQPEGTFFSDYGETTMTKSREGVDQSEGVFASEFGETTKTATGEGTDESERTSIYEDQ